MNKCEVEQLSTSVMNMTFLDRFKNQQLEPLICRESGTLVGCSPDLKEGIQGKSLAGVGISWIKLSSYLILDQVIKILIQGPRSTFFSLQI